MFHEFGRSLVGVLVGETKDRDHLCSSRAGSIDVHCALPCQAWRQHLPQHQGDQPGPGHCPWDGTTDLEEPVLPGFEALVLPCALELSRLQQFGRPSLNKICTRHRVQSQKEHLFYKKTHCKRPLRNCSCWSSQLRAQQHFPAPLSLRALR